MTSPFERRRRLSSGQAQEALIDTGFSALDKHIGNGTIGALTFDRLIASAGVARSAAYRLYPTVEVYEDALRRVLVERSNIYAPDALRDSSADIVGQVQASKLSSRLGFAAFGGVMVQSVNYSRSVLLNSDFEQRMQYRGDSEELQSAVALLSEQHATYMETLREFSDQTLPLDMPDRDANETAKNLDAIAMGFAMSKTPAYDPAFESLVRE